MSRSSGQGEGHTSQKRDLQAFAGGLRQRWQACLIKIKFIKFKPATKLMKFERDNYVLWLLHNSCYGLQCAFNIRCLLLVVRPA